MSGEYSTIFVLDRVDVPFYFSVVLHRFGRSVSLKTDATRRRSQNRILIQLVQCHDL